jgi:hypothetical protein
MAGIDPERDAKHHKTGPFNTKLELYFATDFVLVLNLIRARIPPSRAFARLMDSLVCQNNSGRLVMDGQVYQDRSSWLGN